MQSRSLSGAAPKLVAPWMLGKSADLTYFFLPVILGLALFYLSQSELANKSMFWAAILGFGMAIGPFHQGPTLFTYFDKANRQYYSSSWKNISLFFVMPPVLITTAITAAFVNPLALFVVVSLWHIHHLVQQNIRVLYIYHGRSSETNEALPDYELTATTQWGAAIICTLASCARTNFIGLQFLPGLNILIGALSVWLLVRSVQYLLHLQRQLKNGSSLNVPALGLWFVGMFSMVPVAFLGQDFFAPFVVPLMIHWIQFIGLNIFLVRRKYKEEQIKNLPASRPLLLLLTFCATYMLSYVLILKFADPSVGQEWWRTAALGFTMGLGMCHYFLDTYIWRFDQPFQKKAFLSYLETKQSP